MKDESFGTTGPVRYDRETEMYRAQFDSAAVEPSVAVVNMMASILDEAPTQLDPLYDVVDPDALDRLAASRAAGGCSGDWVVRFTYLDHRVRIKSYGIIEVRAVDTEDAGEF